MSDSHILDSGKGCLGKIFMSDISQLENAPIREAIIDIRIQSQSINLDELEGVVSSLGEGFDVLPMMTQELEFKGGAEGFKAGSQNSRRIGFRCENKGKGFVAMFKIDGFVFSKLEPYTNWLDFSGAAKEFWEIYTRVLADYSVTRIAVRYVNRICLPLGEDGKVNLESYLVNDPKVPESAGDSLHGFFNRVEFPYQDKALCVVTQASQPAEDGFLPVILDIDVFREIKGDLKESAIWSSLDEIREVKNRIFVDSIENETMELFK